MVDLIVSQDALRVREAALKAWGCPRGDKFHYWDQASAERGSRQMAERHAAERDQEPREVYRCPCGGWVFGRPVHRPTPPTVHPNGDTTS